MEVNKDFDDGILVYVLMAILALSVALTMLSLNYKKGNENEKSNDGVPIGINVGNP